MEEPKIGSLDFSQFHDLEHRPFGAYCRGLYPRGWRAGFHHLGMEWEYRLKGELLARTLCKAGRHRMTTWSGRGQKWQACMHCGERAA